MEYGKLIRDAWNITWRYRFLWVLGLLAGGSAGLPGLNGGAAELALVGAPPLDKPMSARQIPLWPRLLATFPRGQRRTSQCSSP